MIGEVVPLLSPPVLEDLLQPHLRLVVCGSAAGTASARLGAYYAGPGNRFYAILHAVGLTDRVLLPEEYRDLLGYGVGLTDVAKFASGPDHAIARADDDPGAVRRKVLRLMPRVLAFNGKRAAERVTGRPDLPYGLLPERIGQTLLFVCPSTSGAARRYWDPRVWHALSELVHTFS